MLTCASQGEQAFFAGQQIELVAIHIELGDNGRTSGWAVAHKSRCRALGLCASLMLETYRKRIFARINARSPILCIRRCTHLWLTASAIELHSASVIRQYPQRPLCSS